MEVLPQQSHVFNNNRGEEYLLIQALEAHFVEEFGDDDYALESVESLMERLENELRAAKTRLSVGEVLLPNNLTERIARDLLTSGSMELCGLRGCTLRINFEGEVNKQLATIKFDSTTPSTYELILTLKQSTAGWNSFLPQFLKKIARGGTIMISPEYGLANQKLYSFFSD